MQAPWGIDKCVASDYDRGMISTKRPVGAPHRNQRKQFDSWRAVLVLWDTGNYSVTDLAEKFQCFRQAMTVKLRNALAARERGWI